MDGHNNSCIISISSSLRSLLASLEVKYSPVGNVTPSLDTVDDYAAIHVGNDTLLRKTTCFGRCFRYVYSQRP